MKNNIVYERDLLYPTESLFDPGSIHVKVMEPTLEGRIPVIIEAKTSHSPVTFINPITRIVQTDVFDRILVDLKKHVDLYIKPGEELKKEYEDKEYILVTFDEGKYTFTALDEIIK